MLDKKMVEHLKRQKHNLLKKINWTDADYNKLRIIDNIFFEEGLETAVAKK